MKAYWSVVCDNCIEVIPLLEYDPTKRRQNPPEFEISCIRCKQKAIFHESEIQPPRQIEPRAGFLPVKGFSNV